MGLFDSWLGGNKAPVVAEGEVVAIRTMEIAERLKRPTAPNFGPADTSPCERCGTRLAEVLITTGGVYGLPEVWRDCPIMVDGWACVGCGVFRYPRPMPPERIHEFMSKGLTSGQRGDFVDAESWFARIVWDWPGYVPGHVNYAGATRDRLARSGESDPAVRRRLVQRMVEHYETTVDAYVAEPEPRVVDGVARACVCIAEVAIEQRAHERARRYLDICLQLRGVDEATMTRARDLAQYIDTRFDLFEDAASVLSPLIPLSGRPVKLPASPEERKMVVEAMEKLERHVALAPDRWQAAWLFSKGHFVLGQRDAAMAMFQRTYERFASEPAIARDYSQLLLENHRNDDAREVARAITRVCPDDATLWCNLGVAELLCGDLDAAERALLESRSRDPNDRITQLVLARLASYRRGRPAPRSLAELERQG